MSFIAKPEVRTSDLEAKAIEVFKKFGATSAFYGYKQGKGMPAYPGYICISINQEIVHGIPGNRRIECGDLVSVDVGVNFKGYIGDGATTYVIEGADMETRKLAKVTYDSLHLGIKAANNGGKVSDISRAIQTHVESFKYNVVRDLVGHGVGIKLHEDPQVPNFVDKYYDAPLREGMIIAIEPMVCMGGWKVSISKDDCWTVKSVDNSLSAHFEHSILIEHDKTVLLTVLDDGSEAYIPPEV